MGQLTDAVRQLLASRAGAGQDTLGSLSCAGRVTQRDGFRRLLRDPDNRALYDLVKDSFVLVCLDPDARPESVAETARAAFTGNCANRWFHASLQIVVFGNAKACLIFNPDTGLSGNAMMRASSEIHTRATATDLTGASRAPGGPPTIRALDWNLTGLPFDRVREDLGDILDDQRATFDLPGMGRVGLRSRGFSPIELFVVAVQLAAFRLTGRLASISQFVSTAQHRCGGIVTAVVSTAEMMRFQTALAASASNPELRVLLDAAVESQKAACRVARSRLPLSVALAAFRSSQTGARRRYVSGLLKALAFLVRRLGFDDDGLGRDIVLSHPMIVPAVPMLGRPGVRLPYVRQFGLHYQMLDDRTRLTVMPGRSWTTPNADLVAELGASLDLLLTRLGRHD